MTRSIAHALALTFTLAALLSCAATQRTDPGRESHVYPAGAVAADHPLASEAGAEILRAGGNAIDAAVATSFALSVVRPYSCGIGGGGFMVIYLKNDPSGGHDTPLATAIDYRERAPHAITPDYFEDKPDDWSRTSGAAVGVPGTVAGLLHALEEYGTLDRATVMAPAIRLAREGFEADAHMRRALEGVPESAAWIIETFREPAQQGRPITNPAQARALEWIAERGHEGFYEGPIAQAIAARARSAGGLLTEADLRMYRATEVSPLRRGFRGREVLAMPPPSSGGVTMLEALGILERRLNLISGADRFDARFLHVFVEAMKHAFADRAEWLADPEYVDVPIDRLLSDKYLDVLAASVDAERTFEPAHYGSREYVAEDGGTSHISVVDRWGNAVACTETINLVFGSRVAVPEIGVCLNNQMDDFTTRLGEPNAFGLRQSADNLPAPGKRPLSSMSPTIVLDADGEVEIVAGASGGPRIITGTTQVILNVLLFGMSAEEAVGATRVHHQWLPDVVFAEPGGRLWHEGGSSLYETLPRVGEGLRERGHTLDARRDIGVVQLIVGRDGVWEAVSDPRKGGEPAGH